MSLEKRGGRRRRRTPLPRQLLIFPLERRQRRRLWLLPPLEWTHPQEGPPSGMPPPFPWCHFLIRTLIPRFRYLCWPYCLERPTCHPLPPPHPTGCCPDIGPGLFIQRQHFPTMRQKWQSIPTVLPTFYTTTLKMVGDSGSPDNIWQRYKVLGNNCRWKQRSKRVVTLVRNEETKKKPKGDRRRCKCNDAIFLGEK